MILYEYAADKDCPPPDQPGEILASADDALIQVIHLLTVDLLNTGCGVCELSHALLQFGMALGFELPACRKIDLEAPYHALTNAGHITYVELDGDPSGNLEAIEAIMQCMASSGIGYGAINHPVDWDPACGYTGIIGRECPKCHRTETDAAPFERIRRITGYLVGSLERFNDAKLAEVNDRVKHSSI